jgi:citronellol/citronellal dehydrogenase
VLTQPARALTGQFLIDDEVLKSSGVTDFAKYRHPGVREEELIPDFFV